MTAVDEGLRTERRTKLDGGIDTRSGIFGTPDRPVSLLNFRFTEKGSLLQRKGGQQLVIVLPNGAANELPALTATQVAGGTLADGTYVLSYVLIRLAEAGAGAPKQIGTSATVSIAVAAGGGTAGIKLQLFPVNSGDGVGQGTDGADDPINGGYAFTSTNPVYAKKGSDAVTRQTVASFLWDNATRSWMTTMTGYTTNGAAAPNQQAGLPFRKLAWHPGLQATIAWTADRVAYLDTDHAVATVMARANDKSGNAFAFSRLPTKVDVDVLDNIMVASDGVGKPKRMDWQGAAATATWRQLGANPPANPPTLADSGGGGTIGAGTYKYVYTYVYQTSRGDGDGVTAPTITLCESNASPASAPITIAASHNIGVTVTGTSETGLVSINIYRTTASGLLYFYVATISAATGSYNDVAPDSTFTVNTPQPPDLLAGALPNTPPPTKMRFLAAFKGRLWGVDGTWKVSSSSRIIRTKMKNTVMFSKAAVGVPTAADPTAGLSYIGFDAWPALNSLFCGSFAPITGLLATRSVLYVFKANEIGVITGDGNSFQYDTILEKTGAMENSMVAVGNEVYAWDQARGPIRITGYSVEFIGSDSIMGDWETTRNSAYISSVRYCPVFNEIRWATTNWDVAYGSTPPTEAREMVLYLDPQGAAAFSIFQGATGSHTATALTIQDRVVMAGCQSMVDTGSGTQSARGIFDAVFGDFYGRLMKDDQYTFDLDNGSASGVAMSVAATMPFFFGDSIEMVKLHRFLYLVYNLAAAPDTLTVKLSSLSKPLALVTLGTLSGSGSFASPPLAQKTTRLDFPPTWDGTNPNERGVQVVISGTARLGLVKLQALALKWKDLNDMRTAP